MAASICPAAVATFASLFMVASPLPVFAAAGVPQPSAATMISTPPIEEFPGAVPVSVPRLSASPKWRRVVEAHPRTLQRAECARSSVDGCAHSHWARWNDLVRKVSALEGEERLQAANEAINTLLTYATDDEVYGVGDHWATLQESMARGRGDCEDIAIAKMWLLNAAGIDLSSMRLVVLKDTLRNVDHAVLSVIENGHQYVLDNMAWKIGRADWMRGYRPIYALSSGQSWIYGMRVPEAPPLQVAQGAAQQLPQ
jgi:predicted transglutaminase-like cysteine proteinase